MGDDLEQLQVLFAFAEREDFHSSLVAIRGHSIQVQANQVRFHRGKCLGKASHMAVTVVLVVDDPHVFGVVVFAQVLADGDEVLRFATPAAVVVNPETAAKRARPLYAGEQLLGGFFDLGLTV